MEVIWFASLSFPVDQGRKALILTQTIEIGIGFGNLTVFVWAEFDGAL